MTGTVIPIRPVADLSVFTHAAGVPVLAVSARSLEILRTELRELRPCKDCGTPTFDPWCSDQCWRREDGGGRFHRDDDE